MFYGTGGIAFTDATTNYSNAGLFVHELTANFPFTGRFDSRTRERIGWTAGGGIEWMPSHQLDIRRRIPLFRFRQIDGSTASSAPGSRPVNRFWFQRLCRCYRRSHHLTENQVQARVSYKFDWFAPVRSSPNTKIEARTSTFGRTRTRPSRPGFFVASHRIGTCAKARQAGIKSSLASPLYLFLEAGTLRGNVSAAWNESAIKTAMQRPAMDARHVSSCGGSRARSRRDAWKHAKNPLRVSTLCPFVRHL